MVSLGATDRAVLLGVIAVVAFCRTVLAATTDTICDAKRGFILVSGAGAKVAAVACDSNVDRNVGFSCLSRGGIIIDGVV